MFIELRAFRGRTVPAILPVILRDLPTWVLRGMQQRVLDVSFLRDATSKFDTYHSSGSWVKLDFKTGCMKPGDFEEFVYFCRNMPHYQSQYMELYIPGKSDEAARDDEGQIKPAARIKRAFMYFWYATDDEEEMDGEEFQLLEDRCLRRVIAEKCDRVGFVSYFEKHARRETCGDGAAEKKQRLK